MTITIESQHVTAPRTSISHNQYKRHSVRSAATCGSRLISHSGRVWGQNSCSTIPRQCRITTEQFRSIILWRIKCIMAECARECGKRGEHLHPTDPRGGTKEATTGRRRGGRWWRRHDTTSKRAGPLKQFEWHDSIIETR